MAAVVLVTQGFLLKPRPGTVRGLTMASQEQEDSDGAHEDEDYFYRWSSLFSYCILHAKWTTHADWVNWFGKLCSMFLFTCWCLITFVLKHYIYFWKISCQLWICSVKPLEVKYPFTEQLDFIMTIQNLHKPQIQASGSCELFECIPWLLSALWVITPTW